MYKSFIFCVSYARSKYCQSFAIQIGFEKAEVYDGLYEAMNALTRQLSKLV